MYENIKPSLLILTILCSTASHAGNPYRIQFDANEPESSEETPEKTKVGKKPKTRNYYKMLEMKRHANGKGEEFENSKEPYGKYFFSDANVLIGGGIALEEDENINKGTLYIDVGTHFYIPSTHSKHDISGVFGLEGYAIVTPSGPLGGQLHVYGSLFKDFDNSDVSNKWGVAFFSPDLTVRIQQNGRTMIRPMITGLMFRPKNGTTLGVLVGPHFAWNHNPNKPLYEESLPHDPESQLTAEYVPVDQLPKKTEFGDDPRKSSNPGFNALAIVDLRLHQNIRFELETGVGEVFFKQGDEILERVHLNNEAKLILMTGAPIGFFIKGQFNQYWLKNSENYSKLTNLSADVNADGTSYDGAVFVGLEFGEHMGSSAWERSKDL